MVDFEFELQTEWLLITKLVIPIQAKKFHYSWEVPVNLANKVIAVEERRRRGYKQKWITFCLRSQVVK